MNILLSSVGRRPYLVRWFKEALRSSGNSGEIVASDMDLLTPLRGLADRFRQSPGVTSPKYVDWLSNVIIEDEIDLALSINDFELSLWSSLPREDIWSPLMRLSRSTQLLVEDKFEMSRLLSSYNIPTPSTWLATSAMEEISSGSLLVTKGRYGSASRGLHFATKEDLALAVSRAEMEVTDSTGSRALTQGNSDAKSLVVIQERILGDEYGLDVVSDLQCNYVGVLARRKLAMRGGETDRAITVDPSKFDSLARAIAKVVPHKGTIDVDVMVDTNGSPFVIDINPRFGGGYPFCHLAGADIPSAYVGWMFGNASKEALAYEYGIVSGKFVETARIGCEEEL